MIKLTIPGANYAITVNPFDNADRALLDAATVVTCTVFGSDKAPVLRDNAAKLALFGAAFRGLTVTTSSVNASQEFSVTVTCERGMAFYFGVLIARLAGRQQSIKAASDMEVYSQNSKVRKQFIKQFAPSLCSEGSSLRDCNDADLFSNPGYVTMIDPIFRHYGLYRYGSIVQPATV